MLMVGYGFGASFVALFMQLGGGIYTKAADVGADMVGKIEVRMSVYIQYCDGVLRCDFLCNMRSIPKLV